MLKKTIGKNFLSGKVKLFLVTASGLLSLIIFRYYLFLHGAGAERSILISGVIGLFYFIFVYYLSGKYFFPDFGQTTIALWGNNLVLSLLAGISITFWFPFYEKNIQHTILRINEWFVNSSFEIFPLTLNKWYYRPISQILMSLGFAFLLFLINQLVFLIFKWKKVSISYKRINSIYFYVVMFCYLSGVFATGFMTERLIDRSTWFFGGTEEMITDRLRDDTTFIEDIKMNGGFNYYFIESTSEKFIYKSTTGFYGSVLKLIQSIFKFNADLFIKVCRVLFALFFAFDLMLILHKTRKLFGYLAAFIFGVLVSVILWIVGPAKLLVGLCFIAYLPFVLPWFLYPNVLNGKWDFKKFCFWIFFIEFALSLKDYTYISNTILAPTVAVVFYELKRNSGIKQLISRTFFTGLCGFLAFISVMGIHLAQLSLFEHSITSAFGYITGRAEARISGTTIPTYYETGSYLEVFTYWIKNVGIFVEPVSKVTSFALFGRQINLNNLLSMHILYFVIFLTSLGVFLWRWIKQAGVRTLRIGQDKILCLSLTSGWAMLCSWTWFLAKNHMAEHPHMNGTIYFLPFGLTLIMLIGAFFEKYIGKIAGWGQKS